MAQSFRNRTLAKLERVSVDAPLPYLRSGRPVIQFSKLRAEVLSLAGFDFLAKVELIRPRNFISPIPGIAHRSRHICGDCFDFDITSDRYVLVQELLDGKQYWRVFLRTSRDYGRWMELETESGQQRDRFVDFTDVAKKAGFIRIPAWRGWSHEGAKAKLREFWHYELSDNLTWDEAISFLYGRQPHARPFRLAFNDRTFGLNDRGAEIRNIQIQLATLKHLPPTEVDGVFGIPTLKAVKQFQRTQQFQRTHRLEITGLADPETRRRLSLEILAAVSLPHPTRSGTKRRTA